MYGKNTLPRHNQTMMPEHCIALYGWHLWYERGRSCGRKPFTIESRNETVCVLCSWVARWNKESLFQRLSEREVFFVLECHDAIKSLCFLHLIQVFFAQMCHDTRSVPCFFICIHNTCSPFLRWETQEVFFVSLHVYTRSVPLILSEREMFSVPYTLRNIRVLCSLHSQREKCSLFLTLSSQYVFFVLYTLYIIRVLKHVLWEGRKGQKRKWERREGREKEGREREGREKEGAKNTYCDMTWKNKVRKKKGRDKEGRKELRTRIVIWHGGKEGAKNTYCDMTWRQGRS